MSTYEEGFRDGIKACHAQIRSLQKLVAECQQELKVKDAEITKLKDSLQYQYEKVAELKKDDELLRNQIDYMMNGKEDCNQAARITILAKDVKIKQLEVWVKALLHELEDRMNAMKNF